MCISKSEISLSEVVGSERQHKTCRVFARQEVTITPLLEHFEPKIRHLSPHHFQSLISPQGLHLACMVLSQMPKWSRTRTMSRAGTSSQKERIRLQQFGVCSHITCSTRFLAPSAQFSQTSFSAHFPFQLLHHFSNHQTMPQLLFPPVV